MPVTRVTEILVACDECSEMFAWTLFGTVAEALREVRGSGWVGTSRRILCAGCANNTTE